MKVSKHIISQMHKAAKLNAEAKKVMAEIENYLTNKGIDPELLRGTLNYEEFNAPDYLTELDYGIDVTNELVAYLETEYRDF